MYVYNCICSCTCTYTTTRLCVGPVADDRRLVAKLLDQLLRLCPVPDLPWRNANLPQSQLALGQVDLMAFPGTNCSPPCERTVGWNDFTFGMSLHLLQTTEASSRSFSISSSAAARS